MHQFVMTELKLKVARSEGTLTEARLEVAKGLPISRQLNSSQASVNTNEPSEMLTRQEEIQSGKSTNEIIIMLMDT